MPIFPIAALSSLTIATGYASVFRLALGKISGASVTTFRGHKALAKVHDAQGLSENQEVAQRGGKVAGDARKAIESDTVRPVITAQNAVDFSRLISNVIEGSDSGDENQRK